MEQKNFSLRLTVAALSIMASLWPAGVSADRYDDQIKVLSEQADRQQAQASRLGAEADTLAGKLERLKLETAALKNRIALGQAQYRQGEARIAELEARLAQERARMRESIRRHYIDSQTTTIEMLASSKNLSEFFDQSAYQEEIKAKLEAQIREVGAAREEVASQQKRRLALLADQKNMNEALRVQEAQTRALVAQTRGQEASYRKQVQGSKSEIARLEKEQAEAIAEASRRAAAPPPPPPAPARPAATATRSAQSASSPQSNASAPAPAPTRAYGGACDKGQGNGGYPMKWCDAPLDAYVDSWGMYSRECVSYTAWKIATTKGFMPYWGGRGHAKQWPGNARAAGIPVSVGGGARVGDIAIFLGGPYGHAMYVEQVKGSSVVVSEFNAQFDGKFSYSEWPMSKLQFIHF